MTDLLRAYRAVRTERGLIDRADIGVLAICGTDRFSWLQGMISNDITQLERTEAVKEAVPSLLACILDATGHILTDLSLIAVPRTEGGAALAGLLGLPNEEFVLAILPRANRDKILAVLDRFLIAEDVELKDVSDALGCLSIQGPMAARGWDADFLQADDLFVRGADHQNAICVRPADHTGSGGYDIYLPSVLKSEIREAILQADVPEIGPEAQALLRIEAGIPLYGIDMDESTLAPEANLMQTHISLTKGCYVGQEIVARIHSRGHTNRALTGLVFAAGDVPLPGDKIYVDDAERRETGRITSVAAASPAVNGCPIALGYVRHEHRAPGSALTVGQTRRPATVSELPFYPG